jgi:E3 ubiquitin-protein ligase UBR7
MVVRDSVTDSWRILNGDSTNPEELIRVENGHTSASSGVKRPLSPSALEEPDAKRVKSLSNKSPSQSKCLAPSQSSLARKILSDSSSSLGFGDIFCTFNFRERWCHCGSVSIVSCAILRVIASSLVFAISSSRSVSS